jgi:hypothetical protein
MKPKKNRVFCPDCGRPKMRFESEKKADTFIKFNRAEIEAESGFGPKRSYFCAFCAAWHVTSIEENIGASIQSQQMEAILDSKVEAAKRAELQPGYGVRRIEALRNELIAMNTQQQNEWCKQRINELQNAIDQCNSASSVDLKCLRIELDVVFNLRKQLGLVPKNIYFRNSQRKDEDDWLKWFNNTKDNLDT